MTVFGWRTEGRWRDEGEGEEEEVGREQKADYGTHLGSEAVSHILYVMLIMCRRLHTCSFSWRLSQVLAHT